MLNTRFVRWLAGITLVVGFGLGLLHLFSLRFSQGDVYPQYSTLRSDPLGTKVLYEAFSSVGTTETQRNFRPIQRLKPVDRVTLFYIGVAQESFWGKSELQHFERLVGSGSRAVFAFTPQQPLNAQEKKEEKAKSEAAEEKKGDGSQEGKAEKPKDRHEGGSDAKNELAGAGLISFNAAAARWGVGIARAVSAKPKPRRTTKADDEQEVAASLAAPDAALESDLPYRSAIYFKDLQPTWRVLYRVAEQPVVIERRWGDGTIVLVGDPFFLSNEALRDEPRPKLLSWLAGSARTIIFDEEHHGIRENTGIAALAQKYRLQGAIIALLVVVALAIWRSAVPFVRIAQDDDDDRVEGRDSAEAFTSLLRRSVPPSRILDVCVDEWRKSYSRSTGEVAAVESVLDEEAARPARGRNPVRTYRRISEALTQSPQHRRTRGIPYSPNAT